MNMVFEVNDDALPNAKMLVVGVGGAGGNAVNRMVEEHLNGVEFISMNTDAQALSGSKAGSKLQLGARLTRGLGAGARPEVGRQALAESEREVRALLEGADLVFVTAGMGGGTGTGAAPMVAEIARELGALTIGIVSKPFGFEGPKRLHYARRGLTELRRAVDTMIVVANERLLTVLPKGASVREALKKADEVLFNATRGISDLVHETGDVNVDFADVRTVMLGKGPGLMGAGEATGDDRALEAAREAISSPLLDDVSISGATDLLVNVSGGPDVAMSEVSQAISMVREEAGYDAEVIFGTVTNDKLEGLIRVTVIATGFEGADEADILTPEGRGPVSSTGRSLRAGAAPASLRGSAPSPWNRHDPLAGRANQGHGGGARTHPTPRQGMPPMGGPVAARRQSAPEREPGGMIDLEIPTFILRQMD